MITILFKNTYFFSVSLMLLLMISCANKQSTIAKKETANTKKTQKEHTIQTQVEKPIVTGADRFHTYLPLIKGKNIAIVANQTSVMKILQRESRGPSTMGSKVVTHHIVDYYSTNYSIKVKTVFSPEHGFRGKADASETVSNGVDIKTGIPIISLYGKNKKPTQEQLKGLDAVVFDIQDLGVRFYTYISTLHYVMEACAEANVPLIVLDRPNPNGHYIDGPVLEKEHTSFVGKHPVPVVYGMTIGEYAQMINGENWLKNNLKCDLKVIELENYTHNSEYSLALRPSPNIPNDKAVNLYPSLGFFEGTTINSGRGTEFQFQRYGAPFFPKSDFNYTPNPNFGAKHPKHKGQLCNGVDLSNQPKLTGLNLNYLIDAYTKTPKNKKFFGPTFTIHAGTEKLQEQIEQGLSSEEIKKSWKKGLEVFKEIREKYLIYN
jgi:uncharacterized protein YbbC (DUF1343 family)